MDQTQKYKPLRAQVILAGERHSIVCPVCEYVLKDNEDVKSVRENEACYECVLTFKYAYKKQWESGWRPTKDEARAKMHI